MEGNIDKDLQLEQMYELYVKEKKIAEEAIRILHLLDYHKEVQEFLAKHGFLRSERSDTRS